MEHNVVSLVCIYFFRSQVQKCPEDYRLWQQTMYAPFGQKWAKLHHGPLWSIASPEGSLLVVFYR